MHLQTAARIWRLLKLYPDDKRRNHFTQAADGHIKTGASKKIQANKWTELQLVEFMPSAHVTDLLNERFVFDKESGCVEIPDNGAGGLGVSLRGDKIPTYDESSGSSESSDNDLY